MGHLEIRRDGTILFGYVCGKHSDDPTTIWAVYEPWCSGLYLFKDLLDRYGIAQAAVAQFGISGSTDMRLAVYEATSIPLDTFTIEEPNMCLEPILLGEGWDPKSIFRTVALELSNALGRESTIPCNILDWLS